MGKAEYGSPKYIAKQMKARGLQRLRWYCQVCEKQCRDENGFKCHTNAPSHLAKVLEKGDRSHTEEYSRQFEQDFLRAMRLSHGTKPVGANRVYNDYIHNKSHIHMTATKWPSLAAFVRHLGASGICSVTTVAGDGPPEFVLTLIDRSVEEQRAKQEHIREERAQANAESAQAVLKAQLLAAQETEDAPPPVIASPCPNTPKPEESQSETKESSETSNKPVGKISFSLAKKRKSTSLP